MGLQRGLQLLGMFATVGLRAIGVVQDVVDSKQDGDWLFKGVCTLHCLDVACLHLCKCMSLTGQDVIARKCAGQDAHA